METSMEKLSFLLCSEEKCNQAISHAFKLESVDKNALEDYLFNFICSFSVGANYAENALTNFYAWKNSKNSDSALCKLIKFLCLNKKKITIPIINVKAKREGKDMDDMEYFISQFNEEFSLHGVSKTFRSSCFTANDDDNAYVKDLKIYLSNLISKYSPDEKTMVKFMKIVATSYDVADDDEDLPHVAKTTDADIKSIKNNTDFSVKEMANIEMVKVDEVFIPCDSEDDDASPDQDVFAIHNNLGSDKYDIINVLKNQQIAGKTVVVAPVTNGKSANGRGSSKKSVYEIGFDSIKSKCNNIIDLGNNMPGRKDGISDEEYYNTLSQSQEAQCKWQKMSQDEKKNYSSFPAFRSFIKEERTKRGITNEKKVTNKKIGALERKAGKYSQKEEEDGDKIVDVCHLVGDGKIFVNKNGYLVFCIGKNSTFSDNLLKINEFKKNIGLGSFNVTGCCRSAVTPKVDNQVHDYCCKVGGKTCDVKHERGKCCESTCKIVHKREIKFSGFENKECALIITDLRSDLIIPFKSTKFHEYYNSLDIGNKTKTECVDFFQKIYKHWISIWYMRCKQNIGNFFLYEGEIMSLAETLNTADKTRKDFDKMLDSSSSMKSAFSSFCKNGADALEELDDSIRELFIDTIDRILAATKNEKNSDKSNDKAYIDYLTDTRFFVEKSKDIIKVQKMK